MQMIGPPNNTEHTEIKQIILKKLSLRYAFQVFEYNQEILEIIISNQNSEIYINNHLYKNEIMFYLNKSNQMS